MAHPTEPAPDDLGGRNSPTSHDASSAEFRIAFFAKLGEWLRGQRDAAPRGRVLDFGCGDLLLARQLDGVYLVDGHDESALARRSARATLAQVDQPGVVFDEVGEIPHDAYDAIVVNSFFQYIDGREEAAELFATLAPLLPRDAAVGIVITDAVSDGSSKVRDLYDLVHHLYTSFGLVVLLRGLIEGIRSGYPSRRHENAESELREAAASVGLELHRHPENLSTFTRRATFILRHPADA